MNNNMKEQYALLKQFAAFRSFVLANTRNEENEKSEEKLSYLASLMYMPVTEKSLFHENQWDYNGTVGMSVNCKGSVLIIDYECYENIPEFIITEIKCLTHLYVLTPSSFRTRNRKRKVIKPNTLVGLTKYGLAYIDTLFKVMGDEYGEEYIHNTLYSLSEINRDLFGRAANNHKQSYSSDLKIFLDNLSHPFSKFLFDRLIQCNDSSVFEWKLERGYTGRKPQQVMKDDVFEKLVFNSSLLISDFLITQGIEPNDKISVSHLNLGFHGLKLCSDMGVNQNLFNTYALIRLKEAGYDKSFITLCLDGIEKNDFIYGHKGKLVCRKTISDHISNSSGLTLKKLSKLLAIVKFASQYIFAQFTGMRPSELSETLLNCIVEENGCYLIKGKIIKGKQALLKGLFDEKWIAIPIVRDAIKAISILSHIHQNTHLFSSIKTAKPIGELSMMRSVSITHQTNLLIEYIFGDKNPEGLVFNTYMTRHTLGYQMFRADIGLPFISYQLKHLVDDVSRYTSIGQYSDVTLCYGGIGEALEKGTRGLRKRAEIEGVKSVMNPDGIYLGEKGKEHKDRLQKVFQGYMAEGYTKEEIYEALAEQGIALINVGQGFCYGGRSEDFDENIPCIGSLRCNPIRCKNAIVTKVNAPKWREIYLVNKINLNKPEFSSSFPQIREAMKEAQSVLEYLGEEVNL